MSSCWRRRPNPTCRRRSPRSRTMIAKGVAGIALAPTDPNALAPVVDAAKAKGIPVVFVDTKGINEGVTFIGTNNEVGAKLAADFICSKIEKGSDVAILQGIITQSTGQARADGAKSGLEGCGLKVVAEQTGGMGSRQGPVGDREHPDRQSQHQGDLRLQRQHGAGRGRSPEGGRQACRT